MDEERKERRIMSRVLRVFYVDTNTPPGFNVAQPNGIGNTREIQRNPSVSLDRRSKTLSKVINKTNQTSIVPY